MKIFSYDMETQARGELVGTRSVCRGHGGGTMTTRGNQEWLLLGAGSVAVDSANLPITAEQYGQDAICFCIGEMRCGTDTFWDWVIIRKEVK